ncbi:hypothetical protein C8J56DRAFT_254649 [Mycena floridula]|nr:hypothetical protein C8J56DRAFT_254649 [Mycena floridula]
MFVDWVQRCLSYEGAEEKIHLLPVDLHVNSVKMVTPIGIKRMRAIAFDAALKLDLAEADVGKYLGDIIFEKHSLFVCTMRMMHLAAYPGQDLHLTFEEFSRKARSALDSHSRAAQKTVPWVAVHSKLIKYLAEYGFASRARWHQQIKKSVESIEVHVQAYRNLIAKQVAQMEFEQGRWHDFNMVIDKQTSPFDILRLRAKFRLIYAGHPEVEEKALQIGSVFVIPPEVLDNDDEYE